MSIYRVTFKLDGVEVVRDIRADNDASAAAEASAIAKREGLDVLKVKRVEA